MADQKLIGRNYTTPDLVAKVTGKAKYAEDFRAEGMLFAKLLLSPMPHARVTRLDASEALALPGVKAILTADDLPAVAAGANLGEGIVASAISERGLTMEPMYEGEPIAAVAAVDEWTAAEAIERIQLELEPLPFTVDPLASLRPRGANARADGNVWVRPQPASSGGPQAPAAGQQQGQQPARPPERPPAPQIKELKWTDEDFAAADEGRLPLGQHTDQWIFGDLDAGFKQADLILDETFVGPNTTHHPLETRSAMAYWQNGKLFMHCSTQSTMRTIAAVARWVGIDPGNVVIIGEYAGGGFGSKGSSSVFTVIPALLSKKANAPVMMRISRLEEQFIGRARPALHSRVKVGFRKDGRITALDALVVVDNGPYDVVGDARSAGDHVSLSYQPLAMRWRAVTVLTNTPPRGAQRAPGGMQGNALMEPILAKAAHQLGLDQVAIHKINAPEGKASFGGPTPNGRRNHTTSAFLKEAIDRGAELFDWDARRAHGGQRSGPRVRGLGMGVSAYSAGSVGFDGLLVIRPDGRLTLQSGIGNLGTESVFDVHRVAAELLGVPWERCDVVWGDTSKFLPNTCGQGGSQTVHAMTRAAHAAATDARTKLQEIAARELGGRSDDYEVAGERVARKGSGKGLSLAQAAQRAIELGGKYDGHELPAEIHAFTKASASALAGHGLMGVAKDTYPRDGVSKSYVASFAEVEVDTETGQYRVLDCLAVSDCGTVIHPRSVGGQILGGVLMGMGHAFSEKWVYDQHYGVPLARRLYHMRPLTILDAPTRMRWVALDIADPETPVGARGVGESPVGSGFAAVVNAVADAVGHDLFRRAPVTSDMILMALETGKAAHDPLAANV